MGTFDMEINHSVHREMALHILSRHRHLKTIGTLSGRCSAIGGGGMVSSFMGMFPTTNTSKENSNELEYLTVVTTTKVHKYG